METATIEQEQSAPVAETPAQSIQFSRPQLYPMQEAAIYDPARYSLIEAGTKSGKTAGCIIWLAEMAVTGRPGWQYWWVAPIFAQAKIAFRRLKTALNPAAFRANESEMTITFLATKTVICFKGADKPDSLYGEDVYAAVLDEASRMKEESFQAVRSTLTATRGPIRIIGNVKGRKNWFYKLSRKAAAGEPDMAFHKITCHDAVKAGILEQAEIDDAKRLLPDGIFKQLYEAEAADDEGNPFGIKQLKALYRPQLSLLAPVVWGWDFAKSHDWTVGTGLDRHGSMCRLVRFQKPWNETKAEVKLHTGSCPALGDSTGVGDPVVEDLVRKFSVNIEGHVYTSRSKQLLMEGLAGDIQQGGWGIYEGVCSDELESFEYVYTRNGVQYAAPEGCFDDCVNSLALARMMYRRGGYGEPFSFSAVHVHASSGEGLAGTADIWRSNRSSQMIDG